MVCKLILHLLSVAELGFATAKGGLYALWLFK